jgi:hypothetical protein
MADYTTVEVDGEPIEFPTSMSDAEIGAAIQKMRAAKAEAGMSGYAMGLKDPISGGAQLLERILPQPIVERVNALNQALAEYGLVSPLPEGGVSEMVRQEEAAYQAGRTARGEEGFDVPRLLTNIVNPANVALAARGAQLATRIPGLRGGAGQAVAAGAAPAAFTPVTDGDFEEEKTKQIGAGGIGGIGGAVLAKAGAKAANPLVTAAEQRMRDLGVRLTPGQALGGQFARLESFAEQLPLVGSYITRAKERALFDFNKGVINKALSKVDEKLPEDVIGRDAVEYVNKVVSQKYDDALSNVSMDYDKALTTKIGTVIGDSKVRSATGKQALSDELNDIIFSKVPVDDQGRAVLSGEQFKAIESELTKRATSYKNRGSQEEYDIGEALDSALKMWRDSLLSQNPKQAMKLKKINAAYGDVVVMRNAAADTGAENGVFTPKQYKAAVRKRDETRGKTRFAAGKAIGQQEAEAGVETMGEAGLSTVLGRETQALTRAGTTGALGAGAVVDPVSAGITAAVIGVTTPALYSQSGIRAMTALTRNRPELLRKIGKVLEERATKEGSITGNMVIQEYNRLTKPKK